MFTFTGVGFFMHFSTATGTQGDKAYLESRLFYPERRSQCLQFYHYSSGGTDDQLNIWVREYTAENPKGNLRLIKNISGNKSNYLKPQIKNYLLWKVGSHVGYRCSAKICRKNPVIPIGICLIGNFVWEQKIPHARRFHLC